MTTIGHVTLGAGLPKLCVPVMGRDGETLAASCRAAAEAEHDLIEWRADSLQDLSEAEAALSAVRQSFPDTPLLGTVRTREEGGEAALDDAAYFSLLRRLLETGLLDAVDVEYFHDPADRQAFIKEAKEKGTAVIASVHDFEKTPESGDMEALIEALYETGAIPKLAVMPRSAADVLRLLTVTEAAHRRHPGEPLITMAMGRLGAVSRLAGSLTGSAVTFASAGIPSAPGQMEADAVRDILRVMSDG